MKLVRQRSRISRTGDGLRAVESGCHAQVVENRDLTARGLRLNERAGARRTHGDRDSRRAERTDSEDDPLAMEMVNSENGPDEVARATGTGVAAAPELWTMWREGLWNTCRRCARLF